MLQRLFAHKLTIILVACVAARLAVLLAFPDVFAFDRTGAIHGSAAFDDYARNLLATGVYGQTPGVPDAMLPPLYSYVLAAIYGLFGRGYLPVAVFHILLDVLSIIMLHTIAKRLMLHAGQAHQQAEGVAALAGLFYALYPYLIFQNLTLIDTPLFMALLHAFVLAMVLAGNAHNLIGRHGRWPPPVGSFWSVDAGASDHAAARPAGQCVVSTRLNIFRPLHG
jgi:hypothetical protein